MDMELLRFYFSYDPVTGLLTWRNRPSQGVRAGDKAGCLRKTDGYLTVMLKRRTYYVHRICYALGSGCVPMFEVDHEDGNRTNNRFKNLRDTTVNQQNRRRVTKRNLVRVQGVTKAPSGRYKAYISLRGKTIYGGTYDTVEQAHDAYVELKRKHHPGNTL